MLDVRRDGELPSVLDTDPQAVKRLAELLVATVSCELPGTGITHDTESPIATHEAVHDFHGELLMEAARRCEPELGSMAVGRKLRIRSIENIGFHVDPTLRDQKEDIGAINLRLRLHTADSWRGAHVTLVSGRPALNAQYGDAELYRYEGATESYNEPIEDVLTRGYEEGQTFINLKDLLKGWCEGGYDPLYAEAEFLHYQQDPLCSVLFRSFSYLVPRTMHWFQPREPGIEREYRSSDYYLKTQAL